MKQLPPLLSAIGGLPIRSVSASVLLFTINTKLGTQYIRYNQNDSFLTVYEKYDLTINLKKTKVMIVTKRKNVNVNIRISNKNIEQVASYWMQQKLNYIIENATTK